MGRHKMLKIVALLFVPVSLFSQTLGQAQAGKFVDALLRDPKSLTSWFENRSLETSHRLGISYYGVTNKNLISYDIDDSVRGLVNDRRLGYSVSVDTLGEDYARVIFTIDKLNFAKTFYFKNDRCISPLAYFARSWTVIDSKHFRFFISDTTLFNSYCVRRLEAYLGRMAELLRLNERDMRTLEREKIYYYMCRDESEIERMTGYHARGLYNLAYDAVVTTYNTHYHELTHLLINYKLRRLPLYTNPFLQEGFAVAYGGRGGQHANVLLSVGSFLYRSRFVELSQLLNKNDFEGLDATLSYPSAGLYNKFLVEELGINKYMDLYRAHSGAPGDVGVMHVEPSELPPDSVWKGYIAKSAALNDVAPDSTTDNARVIFENGSCRISEDSTSYRFLLSGLILIPGREHFPHYVSTKFHEFFPDSTYRGEKYLVRASAEEVAVYDLLTNDLIANYVESFSIPPEPVARVGGKFSFSIRKSVFDGPISPVR